AYGEQNLSEIAYKLEYSSVAHLSGQFKKVTGMTPTAFKNMAGSRRKPLDQV
ncbi:MAG: helix-turn-helix transcriptional regulator, partial [Lewinellaceae bacterium]|nr:helix-turn-helix transcriptional regulator [Lewinellaceae bacterium]